MPVARAPTRAAASAACPVPVAMSSTRSPGVTRPAAIISSETGTVMAAILL